MLGSPRRRPEPREDAVAARHRRHDVDLVDLELRRQHEEGHGVGREGLEDRADDEDACPPPTPSSNVIGRTM